MVAGHQASLIFDSFGQSSSLASLHKPGLWGQHHTSTATAQTFTTPTALLREADAALMKELAARLDVTHVALSEALERSHQLECENANLRGFINTECFVKDDEDYDYASTRLPLMQCYGGSHATAGGES